VTGLESLPKSPQQPHPPIFIGGGGKRVLTLAAQQADIVGIVPMPTQVETIRASERTEAALERKVSWIRQAAGERFATLELNIQIYDVAVTEDRRQAAEERAHKEIERHSSRTYLTPGRFWPIHSGLSAMNVKS
jgi:alkanesulfonate monooxygenase SsuD/methylene tetrahydromethanopterin reductase-like flavin-dependent oxidoreductase (luciferase family)